VTTTSIASSPSTHHNLDALVEILAGCRKCLGCCILEVPQLVLHAAVEFVRVLLTLQVELDADGGVLGKQNQCGVG